MNGKQIITPFVKSSYSGGASNDCITVARTVDGGHAVRDSKCPAHGTAYYSSAAWAVFLGAMKHHD
ncbi:DUF397 domain-containing protein [Streptomyces sp. NPDC059398]|uniref:DUF397 domain-containing protein n=1 Tax=Streptomyces sp. NPDC059398 TaxID=3346820 RepID=UPI0036C3EFC4